MKILLLADIHGNLPALKAVLDAAAPAACDETWCLGDIVGYGPFPNECVLLVEETARRVISGNHDAKVISAKKVDQLALQKKQAYKVFIFSWTHRTLTPGAVHYLRALPEDDRVTVEGQRVLLTHGSPEGMDDGITVHTPDERLALLAKKARADVVLIGHTHEAFTRRVKDVMFINPGSVGRPFDGDSRAAYAILDLSDKGVGVELYRVAYDMDRVIEEMQRQEFPQILVKAFVASRSPADILPDGVKGDLAEEARRSGERCAFEKTHALQVAKLALKLFDKLGPLHEYPLEGRERALLQAAALLHDVGMLKGADDHHKASRDMILEDKALPLADRERDVVALLARYHRGALPKAGHRYFEGLPDHHKTMVLRLGGILRLADGLDRTHQALVDDVGVDIGQDVVRIRVKAHGQVDTEIAYGRSKSDLFERAFKRAVILE